MGIIIKFVLKNIGEKKLRTFLIVFSITISSALFFASSAMSDTMVKMYTDRMMQYYGDSTILIHSKENSPSPFFSLAGANIVKNRTDYIIGSIQTMGTYKHSEQENVTLTVLGINLEDLQRMNPVTFVDQRDLTPFDGKKLIISKNTAEKYGLKLGTAIDLTIRGTQYKFYISGITQPTGPFMDESQNPYAVVPGNTLASLFEVKGRVGMAYIKVTDPLQKEQVMKDLSEEYKQYTVREPFSKQEIRQQTQSLTTTFLLMSVIVSLMSIFIIYTSFKVVTMERLPVIGTFRSIGATRKMTDSVLLAESTLYGVLGGFLGCILGLGILYIMAVAATPVWQKGYKTTMQYTSLQMVTAFFFAVILSFISCIIPILKVSRLPVKDIVLNSLEKQKKRKNSKYLWGVFFLIVAFIAPPLAPKQFTLPIGVVCMLLSVIAVILLVPLLTGLFIKVFERIYTVTFGNIGILAAKNLRENKSILNNISLLAIGISSLLMINSLSYTVVTELTSFYKTATFDIWCFSAAQSDRNFESLLQKTEGVKEIYGVYEARQIELPEHKGQTLSLIQGVDKNKFLQFFDTDIFGDRQAQLNRLDEGRNIIFTTSLKDKLGLEEGDKITLKMKNGLRTYTVIGFMNTLRNNGNFALASERYVKLDSDSNYYSNLFIKTSKDPDAVLKELKKQFARRRLNAMTVKEMEVLEQQSNGNLFMILRGFSILAMIIGIFGVLNNLIISFIERKRSLAMFRSLGMSKKQVVSMIFIEALSGGLIGGISGVLAGFLMIWGVPYVLKAIDLYVPLHLPWDSLVYYIVAGVVIVVMASISPAIKSSKLNIIQAVKYE